MQGLQPQSLTNKELRKYAELYGIEKLPQEWLVELAKRFVHPSSVRPDYRD